MKKGIYFFCLVLFLISCDKENISFPEGSLAAYIANNAQLAVSNQLIACAAGGQRSFLEDSLYPISVFFLPIEDASNFRYFEAPIDVGKEDLNQYQERNFRLEPLFNGYLRRFLHTGIDQEMWGRVTFIAGDSLHVCNAIRMKLLDKPSEFAPQLVDISFPMAATSPKFSWTDGQLKENEIYFQVVSDQAGNLISGTYTYDTHFQFYELSNVVLNIRDINPAPTLAPNTTYDFTLMGISIDNWVNLIAQKAFTTQ